MREDKQIVSRIVAALTAASMFNPEPLRRAATSIRSADFDADEREIADAFAALLDKRAERKERILQEAFGPKELQSHGKTFSAFSLNEVKAKIRKELKR